MAYAHVQNNRGSSTTDPATGVAFPSNNTAGNLLVAVVTIASNTVTVAGITDTASNTWQVAKQQAGGTAQTNVEIWYAMNCAGTANTVTVDLSGTANSSVWIVEFSGGLTAAALDQVNGAYNNNQTSNQTGAATPTGSNGLAVCGWTYGGAFTITTPPTDYTLIKEIYTRGTAYYKILTDTTQEDPRDVTSAATNSSGAIAIFKVAASGYAGGWVIITG